MDRAYYSASISGFLNAPDHEVLWSLANALPFPIELAQRDAWIEQINILKKALVNHTGHLYFEYGIPRMGKRIDVVLIVGPVIFVLEFKVGDKRFAQSAIDQACGYCLDLKNFHEASHGLYIAPVVIATRARRIQIIPVQTERQNKRLFSPIKTDGGSLKRVLEKVLQFTQHAVDIDCKKWGRGRYRPTPTIIEAALELYNGHSVEEITRHEAEKTDINRTSAVIDRIIHRSKAKGVKSICFVTGVPGAGKTLVGLDVATKHQRAKDQIPCVFLSGNGPLVAVLREALADDHVQNQKVKGQRIKKGEALSKVKEFIQNVHHFRDDCLDDPRRAPVEHVALFDEAQRAWDVKKTAQFMRGRRRKKVIRNFKRSEPEFLISCLDRHKDWAVIVCLVGGGQEIHTGEAGISEWIRSLKRSFPKWHIHISSKLTDSEYGAGSVLRELGSRPNVYVKDELHLAVSMRTFRTERVSKLVKEILDLDLKAARNTWKEVRHKYPIVITRDLTAAKHWLRSKAVWAERYGITVSSHAERLKPYAIDVKRNVNPVHWFLKDKRDVRSSFYLEDVATEFHIQGLELDWVCVTWDADFRYSKAGWQHRSFRGKGWNRIKQAERRIYQKNAYRVLLTRARQGMVIVVPSGDPNDPTRTPDLYNPTFDYLCSVGFETI